MFEMIDTSLPAAQRLIRAIIATALNPNEPINPWGDYPATVAEILDDGMEFKGKTVEALRAFKNLKPHRGNVWEKRDKFYKLYQWLSDIYGIPTPQLVISPIHHDPHCMYIPSAHLIQLNDRFSVVTALHEFGHAIGKDEYQTVKWSINLFRLIFPKEYAKLTPGTEPGTRHVLFRKKKDAVI